MKFKRTVILLTVVVAMGLMLGASAAQAATVERDGENASAIRDLTVDGVTYDVVFCSASTSGAYGAPPAFTFPSLGEAEVAARAVAGALSAEGDIRTVGTTGDPDCPGSPATTASFRIGYEVEPFDIPFTREEVTLTKDWEGFPADDGSGVWDIQRNVLVFFFESAVFAKFTATGTAPPSGNQPPIADAGPDESGEVGVTVIFDGSSSYDPDGRSLDLRFDWDFGDGQTGDGDAPDHPYAASGTYNVILTVTDGDGASDSDTTQAVIGEFSEAPTADAGGPYTGTVGAAMQFDGTGSFDPDSPIERYQWSYGDGTTDSDAGPTPTHVYETAGATGRFNVTLEVFDGDGDLGRDYAEVTLAAGNQPPVADAGAPVTGVVGVPVTFDGTASSDPDGNIVRYDWDYGLGTTPAPDAEATPSYTYTEPGLPYTVILTVTDDAGATDSDYTDAFIDPSSQPPVADAGGPYMAQVGVPVNFDGNGSVDPDGTIAQYDWYFGDNNTALNAGPTTSHTYTASGIYNVYLVVTDSAGDTGSIGDWAIIDSTNQPPVADANGPYVGKVDVPVTFDSTGSSDPDGSIVSLLWSFGDGGFGSGEVSSHTYAAAGVYDVILSVTDDEGAVGDVNTKAYIGTGNLPPVPDAGGPYMGAAGAAVTFDGTGSVDLDGSIVIYEWVFGDGTTGIGPTPDHDYSAGGIYNVGLTVTDDGGRSSGVGTVAIIGSLSRPPVADPGGPYTGRVGRAVQFDGTGSSDPDGGIAAYAWDFGDGTTDSGATPSKTYSDTGNYAVILTVTDDTGETDLTTTQAVIGLGNLPPEADAGGPRNGNPGKSITFSGSIGRDPDSRINGNPGKSITFSGSIGRDPDGRIVEFKWDYGDGSTSGPLVIPASKVAAATAATYSAAATSGEDPVHAYDAPGLYYATLTVTDDDGAVDSDSAVVTVEATDSGGGGGGGGSDGSCFITTAMGQ